MSREVKIIFSFIILFVGLCIFCSEYFESKKIAVYDYMNGLYYNNDSKIDEEDILINEEVIENNEEIELEDTKEEEKVVEKVKYIGYLNIPKINLKKGFTNIESKYNTVSRNIQILDSSDYPDKVNGNVIFASHSGNSSVSYFKKLYLLGIGDNVYIEYNSKNYTYQIVDIYEVEKTGKVNIRRNKDKSILTLITCTKNNSETQTVYISELISVE
ncbi:MAG: sortase [Bacilli bacterium]|nr:sortase [Bacilli bacterium]